MKRAALGAIAVLGLGGCDALKPGSEQIKICEDQLLGTLKSPASYKRISADYTVMDVAKPPYALVQITYDAANSFNALLRDKYSCSFRLDHGKPTTEQFDPYANLAASLDTAVDNALDAMDANTVAPDANMAMSPDELRVAEDYDDDTAEVERTPPKVRNDIQAQVDADVAAADEAVRGAVDNALNAADDAGE